MLWQTLIHFRGIFAFDIFCLKAPLGRFSLHWSANDIELMEMKYLYIICVTTTYFWSFNSTN